MTDTLKRLAGGTLTTGSVTLYTAPSSTTTIVKELILCNKTAASTTVTISFNSVNIVFAKTVAANDSLILPLTSILQTTNIIAGLASSSSAIDYYISGIEIV